jgi:hypothetical protein
MRVKAWRVEFKYPSSKVHTSSDRNIVSDFLPAPASPTLRASLSLLLLTHCCSTLQNPPLEPRYSVPDQVSCFLKIDTGCVDVQIDVSQMSDKLNIPALELRVRYGNTIAIVEQKSSNE